MNLYPKDFFRVSNHMSTWLTHSQIFGAKASKAEIIKDIRSINRDEAILILAKFSMLDSPSKSTLLNNLKPFIRDKESLDSVEPFDLINLMYSIKWFIAYGTNNNIAYEQKHPKPFFVFMTLLKISDHMVENLDLNDDPQDMLLKSWLFNRPGELDKALVRQRIMFEDLARDIDLFSPKEFIDIHEIFEREYGYSIKEYVAILFSLHMPSIQELNLKDVFTNIEWGIDPDKFFDNVKIPKTAKKIALEITTDVDNLKTWARDTVLNPFDYEILLSKPLLKINGRLIPFSPGLINTTIFDGVCFKLNSACRKVKKDFFPFFGRLFENYVSKVLLSAVKNSKYLPYTFIDEFSFGKENKRSSDAYLIIGRTLLIIECKGGRLRKETKVLAQPKFMEGDYTKYAIDPIDQANTAYEQILSEKPNVFNRVNKVYIISVSLQSFPKVPKYNELLNSQLSANLHRNIKGIDYIGLSELELLAYIINFHDFTLFNFIKNKKQQDDYIPYLNYYFKKYGEIKRTKLLDEVLRECMKNIQRTLF